MTYTQFQTPNPFLDIEKMLPPETFKGNEKKNDVIRPKGFSVNPTKIKNEEKLWNQLLLNKDYEKLFYRVRNLNLFGSDDYSQMNININLLLPHKNYTLKEIRLPYYDDFGNISLGPNIKYVSSIELESNPKAKGLFLEIEKNSKVNNQKDNRIYEQVLNLWTLYRMGILTLLLLIALLFLLMKVFSLYKRLTYYQYLSSTMDGDKAILNTMTGDLLKKIANLENEIFGSEQDRETIKKALQAFEQLASELIDSRPETSRYIKKLLRTLKGAKSAFQRILKIDDI